MLDFVNILCYSIRVMSFEAFVFEPKEEKQPSVVGLYAMPIAANLQNSGDRLQTMVDELGFPFIASDLMIQSKKVIFDMAAKTANQPSGYTYVNMSQRRADFLAEQAGRYGPGVRVGMGDSLGVPAIQGIQLYGEEEQKFDAVLLRDGWNLAPTSGKARGIARYLSYTVQDEIQKRIHGVNFDVTDYGYTATPPSRVDETNLLQKIYNVSDMMRGPENRRNALALAMAHGLAMNVVCLEHGLSGTPTQTTKFINDLYVSADHAEDSSLRAEIVPGWHSDLLDPVRGSQDVRNTLSLLGPTD